MCLVMDNDGAESKEGMDAKKPRLPEKGYFAFFIVGNGLEMMEN